MCRYESLVDRGPLMLVDVARMNDALDVRDENNRRASEARENG